MKKHPHEVVVQHERLRRSRAVRKQKRRGVRYDPNKSLLNAPKILGERRLKVPSEISLGKPEGHANVVKLIKSIYMYSKIDRVSLDFSDCQGIHADSLVYLYANLQIIRDNQEHRAVKIMGNSLRGQVRGSLRVSGIMDMLKNKTKEFQLHSAILPPIFHGHDSMHEEILDYLQHRIYDGKLPAAEEHRLADALSEAFLNVKDHAYPADKYPESETPWWAICSVIGHELWLAVFDHGIGIPFTITQHTWVQKRLKILSDKIHIFMADDASKIEFAMTEGKNRRKEAKHGLGSISMHALVEQNPEGQLLIYSNKGRYSWRKDENGEGIHRRHNHPLSINGTLIQWNIALKL